MFVCLLPQIIVNVCVFVATGNREGLCGRTWVCKTKWCVCYGCGLRMAERHLQPV